MTENHGLVVFAAHVSSVWVFSCTHVVVQNKDCVALISQLLSQESSERSITSNQKLIKKCHFMPFCILWQTRQK